MRSLNLVRGYEITMCTANANRSDLLNHIAVWLDTCQTGALTINKGVSKITLEYKLYSTFDLNA